MHHTHILSTSRHQRVKLPSPAKGVDQCPHTTDHVTQLCDIVRPAAPGKGPYQIPVDEQPRDGAAHSSCKAGKGLHLQATESTTTTLSSLETHFSARMSEYLINHWRKFFTFLGFLFKLPTARWQYSYVPQHQYLLRMQDVYNLAKQLNCWDLNSEILHIHLAKLQQKAISVGLDTT